MKNLQGRIISTVLTLFLASLVFVGCNSDKISGIAGPDETNKTTLSMDKLNKGKPVAQNAYPQTESLTLKYDRKENKYWGGNLNMAQGSMFRLKYGALTPPPGTPQGEQVTITMTIEKDDLNNELVFTFGPHGSTFNPGARVYLKWADLGIDIPTLYYIDENGNYIEQLPENIDLQNQWLEITLYHFSRYALARS